jgi:hypothetical protein
MLNETSNKKIKMLNDQTPKEKEMKKTPQPTTNSESVSVSISHEKSDKKLLVGMMWVGVGFRFENPHRTGLGFSGGE